MLKIRLRYFEGVVREGSVRKAAERLHVAASAVNRQILQLEEELGVPLFERLPRGCALRGRRDPALLCAPMAQ
ncbi:LysR family transcriptional regulator [Alcanivorax sp. IO_7]|nr:LysR family transcriptional regulator [Alcanivorax sp. IO_7]